MCTAQRSGINIDRLLVGLFVLGIGVLFTLDQAHIIEVGRIWRYWPLVLIAMGLSALLKPAKPGHAREGLGFLLVGTWLLLNQLGILSYRNSWPLVIVGVGLIVVWNALSNRPGEAETDPPKHRQGELNE